MNRVSLACLILTGAVVLLVGAASGLGLAGYDRAAGICCIIGIAAIAAIAVLARRIE